MRPKNSKLHNEMMEIAEVIDSNALLDVVTFARLKLTCQGNDEITIIADEWERTPHNIKRTIHHALNAHPIIEGIQS